MPCRDAGAGNGAVPDAPPAANGLAQSASREWNLENSHTSLLSFGSSSRLQAAGNEVDTPADLLSYASRDLSAGCWTDVSMLTQPCQT